MVALPLQPHVTAQLKMAAAYVYRILSHFENDETFETMVISNVCTEEESKFSQKIFVIHVMLEEKPGSIKYTITMTL